MPPHAGVRAPKLTIFVDGKDEFDSYLQIFERFAKTAGWVKITWTIKLSTLLSGKALVVYSRMSDDQMNEYDKVKEAILRRYDFTEDGYRNRTGLDVPEVEETPDQFIVRQVDRTFTNC